MRISFSSIARKLLPALALIGICGHAVADSTQIKITNSRDSNVWVSFTNTQGAGKIVWKTGCSKTGATTKASYTMIKPGQTCIADVDSSNGSSRFCAAKKSAPATCWEAQTNHQTLLETNFEPASAPGCFGQGSCVWYDISVIPSACTDEAWRANQCENTGGASYNFPVSMSCEGNSAMPTYVCKGPKSTKYGSANYPSNCGNPHATCAVGTSPGGNPCVDGVATYFFPMFTPPENAYQPNAVCLKGSLAMKFLAGK